MLTRAFEITLAGGVEPELLLLPLLRERLPLLVLVFVLVVADRATLNPSSPSA